MLEPEKWPGQMVRTFGYSVVCQRCFVASHWHAADIGDTEPAREEMLDAIRDRYTAVNGRIWCQRCAEAEGVSDAEND